MGPHIIKDSNIWLKIKFIQEQLVLLVLLTVQPAEGRADGGLRFGEMERLKHRSRIKILMP